jgi:S1-C subfamily serine protease
MGDFTRRIHPLLVLACLLGTTAGRSNDPSSLDRAEGATGGSPAPADLMDLEEKIMATSARALQAMVFIDGGSGVMISADGYIITNYHVIAEQFRPSVLRREHKEPADVEVTVVIAGGRKLKASAAGLDPAGDIALLKVKEPGTYPYLELGDSDGLKIGQWVLAMGNPFLLGESPFAFFSGAGDSSPSISLGVVSALHRFTSGPNDPMYSDAIQVDAAVNPGNSGGPLLTIDGKVVGINGKIQTRERRFQIEVNSGVGYAVPSNQISRFLTKLKKAQGGVVRRGSILGLLVADRGDADHGLEVTRVTQNTPGDRAGFKTGDRILSIDGQPIYSRRRFEGLLATYPAGSGVVVKVDRGGAQREIPAVLDRDAPARLGVKVRSVESPPSVVVRELVKDSPAERAGLQVGDVILQVEGRKIEDVVDLGNLIGEYRSGDTVKVKYRRGAEEVERSIRLDAQDE